MAMALEPRKLYVGGLPLSTQQDELKEHFGRYGEVERVRVVRDYETGLGRGFAFIEFVDDEGPRAALNEKEKDSHVFGGRRVDVKRAQVRKMPYHTQQPFYVHYANQIPVHNQWYNQSCSNNNSYGANRYRGSDPNKVFVGGLRGHITTEDLKNYFEKFGTITDVVVMREPFTQRPRGFGFITFDSEKAMAKVLENSFHNLNGTRVETKMAIPKDHTYGQDMRQHSPMIWRGNSYHMGYGGLYPPHNMQYIVNNHYMVPFQQYMYSPHTPDYGYMANGSVSSNVAASQGTPVYIGHGTHFGYDSLDTDHLDAYGGDSKLNQSMPDEQLLDIQAANISKEQPLNLDSKNIH